MKFKLLFCVLMVSVSGTLSACSTNPATGKQQFTALMSPSQEVQVGAQEHEKIVAQFGLYENSQLTSYVQSIGTRVTQKTERPDVQYKFYILDSPIVNAFAVPGGYIYVSRGLMALANNEAQLAAVLAHEAGHITGRHSAERYSRGVVTSLGAGVISAVLGSDGASQALGVGTNLYLSSYSRDQENEADSLGLRYMTQGGYDPDEMAKFLSHLQAQSGLDARLAGREYSGGTDYFSTHPATSDRVQKTLAEAGQYKPDGAINRDVYLKTIDGMTYGDSTKHGFARGNSFYHPAIGFAFDVPDGFRIVNQPSQVVATSKSGSVIVFDMAKRQPGQNAFDYLTNTWMKDRVVKAESIVVNGMKAATTGFPGTVNGREVILRLVAIEYKNGNFARFQVAIPKNATASALDELKKSTYSFRTLSETEKNGLKPYRLDAITAKSGDTIASLARRMPFTDLQEERFRVLNGLIPGEALVSGRQYKLIRE